jgi:hypothetical protein
MSRDPDELVAQAMAARICRSASGPARPRAAERRPAVGVARQEAIHGAVAARVQPVLPDDLGRIDP